jgi:glycosyltransferase involved in cell wall biosynthesis
MGERQAPTRRLRLCVVGDLDSIHTQRWLRYFVERGHDVHAVSYYRPAAPPEGVDIHVLHPGSLSVGGGGSRRARPARWVAGLPPPSLLRLGNALRYRRRGLGRVIGSLAPDVLHSHYVVEHGFFTATTGYHPHVVTAWGSDILVDARKSPLARAIARYTMARADLITSNNSYMAEEVRRLGVPPQKVATIPLGVDEFFLEEPEASVNVRSGGDAPVVVSVRALEPLYNVDVILRAMALVRQRRPDARLVVAGDGSLRRRLEELAARLDLMGSASFVGRLGRRELREALATAQVSVSVPGSDATAVSTLEAMAVGCFPIVSALPSQVELVEDGVGGFRVPVGDAAALAERIEGALADPDLRRRAAQANREFVRTRALWENNMAEMEAWYLMLAEEPGLTVVGDA